MIGTAQRVAAVPAAQWVLLWSQRLNALRVETVEQMLANGMRVYRDDRATDFVPLLIASREVVEQTARNLRPTLHARQHGRSAGIGSGSPAAEPCAAHGG